MSKRPVLELVGENKQFLISHIPHAQAIGLTVVDARPDEAWLKIPYAKAEDVLARAIITKHGRRVANVRVEAWQGTPDRLVAAAHGHFLMSSSPGADHAE